MKSKILFFAALLIISITGVLLLKYKSKLLKIFEKPVISQFEVAEESVVATFSFSEGQLFKTENTIPHYSLIMTAQDQPGEISDIIEESENVEAVLITIETWDSNVPNPFKGDVLSQILNGDFDANIIKLYEEVNKLKSKVYIRLNPEMDVPAKRYPWQNNLISYVDVFKYFTAYCKAYAPNADVVWAPAGYPGTMDYYPGDEVVAAASITVKSGSESELDVYPKDYSLKYDLQRRLHRLRFIDKPIFVLAPNHLKHQIDQPLIDSISMHIQKERDVAYSDNNFDRPEALKSPLVSKKLIGLYDPQHLLVQEPGVKVEHLFVDFGTLQDGSFEKEFRSVLQRKHKLIISFEPFRIPDGSIDLQVIDNITNGTYDRELAKFYDIISSTNQTIYLRYAHEMEIPITRYPWQSQDPVAYIHSFRYFMKFRETGTEHIQCVWGPAGDRGSIEWYPGDDVVDVFSVAIYGLPDKNITDPEKQESFKTIFNRKTWRTRFINKPLFITEFGVKGPEEYQNRWLSAAAEVIRDSKHVIGINYFNMTDTPKAWGDIKPPDWSITKATFNHFVELLERK